MNEALAQRLTIQLTSTDNYPDYKTVTMIPKRHEEPQRFVETYAKPSKSATTLIEMRAGDPTGPKINSNLPIQEGIKIDAFGNPPTIRGGDVKAIIRIPPIECEAIYLREGMVYTWINRLTGFQLAADPKIICENTRDQTIMDSIISPSQFRKTLKILFNHKYIYGNHILKWDKEGEKIIGIDWIDPKYFDAVRDAEGYIKFNNKGTPIGYVQYVRAGQDLIGIPQDRIVQPTMTGWDYQSGMRGILFLPDEIVQFKLNQLGDSWWGVGLVEPIYNFIRVKQNADEGFGEMMQRTGFPRIIAKVGDPTHPPTQEQIDDIWDKLSDLHTKHQFVGPYYYDFTILESNKPDRFRFNLEYFQHGIVSGLGGPKPFITGIGENTNRATLGDQKLWLERDLTEQQVETTTQFREMVLKPIAEQNNFSSIPVIVWGDISTESLESKADRLAKLAKVGLLIPDEAILKHIREIESLPPAEEVAVKKQPTKSDKGEGDGATQQPAK